MGKPEAYVESYLRKRVREQGWLCYKFVSPMQRGVPDDVIIGNGRIVYVEAKSKDGHLSVLQEETIKHMLSQGADVRVVYTRGQVDELITEIYQNDFKLNIDVNERLQVLKKNPTKKNKTITNT